MNTYQPKIAEMLVHAFAVVKARSQLLMLLAVLTGLVVSIVSAPAYELMAAIAAVFEPEGDETATNQAVELITNGWPTLVWGQLLSTLVNAASLVLWARASLGGEFVPASGGPLKLAERSLRSFWHLTLANILFVAGIFMGATILGMLASAVGFLALVIMFAGSFILVWFAVIVFTVANFALLREAGDHPTSLAAAWQMIQPSIRAASASLACLFLVYFFASAFITSGLEGMGLESNRLFLIVTGTLGFLLSAVHVSALTALPAAYQVDRQA